MDSEHSKDPMVHVSNMEKRFQDLVDHLREDIEIIEDPRCSAMFETSAEVLLGLKKAFSDYQEKTEKAWE